MKTATVKELKEELEDKSHQELITLCLRLSKFKKENKELLTYLLFDSENEENYINTIKLEVEQNFSAVNTTSYYYIKKSVRKILRLIKKYIRYSTNKETEVELLLFFCKQMTLLKPDIKKSKVLTNIYNRELISIKKKITLLHEDLQYDYNLELEEMLTKVD
ncbi:hypothetical protein [Aquimarina algicola]|uniref:Uncharacterized protein n=1 Tax=Aquimarina algicola TaxID=2589995 RepID=A0A504JES3_9FLAO|nr:hypothetical protein [Aquimarina algicola]TPN89174.1 hypothetical protein FHK87_02815 [Aquimarina algicola]